MNQIVATLFALPLLANAANASAEALSSPASFCRAHEGTATDYWDGRVVNNGQGADLWLNCPLLTSSAAPAVKTAKVVFVDQHPDRDVSCRVTSQWITGDGIVRWYESAEMRSSGRTTWPQTRTATVNFGALGENLNFQCSVPPTSSFGPSAVFRYEITR